MESEYLKEFQARRERTRQIYKRLKNKKIHRTTELYLEIIGIGIKDKFIQDWEEELVTNPLSKLKRFKYK